MTQRHGKILGLKKLYSPYDGPHHFFELTRAHQRAIVVLAKTGFKLMQDQRLAHLQPTKTIPLNDRVAGARDWAAHVYQCESHGLGTVFGAAAGSENELQAKFIDAVKKTKMAPDITPTEAKQILKAALK